LQRAGVPRQRPINRMPPPNAAAPLPACRSGRHPSSILPRPKSSPISAAR